MDKEEAASRIKDLMCKYKEKKDELENYKTDYEKLRKHRKVKRYLELSGLMQTVNKDMQEIVCEVAALEKKFKENEE